MSVCHSQYFYFYFSFSYRVIRSYFQEFPQKISVIDDTSSLYLKCPNFLNYYYEQQNFNKILE